MRVLLRFEFDGTCYSGWQVQPGAVTVQGVIEDALQKLCRRPVRVTGAGRTDAGVHALDMPVHLDIADEEFSRIEKGLNSMLPPDIACREVVKVEDDFHSRFDALSRSYIYRTGKSRRPLRRFAEYQPGEPVLNTELMQRAALLSIGENSWKGFSKEGSGNSTWNINVTNAEVQEDSQGWSFCITADRFLRGVVRIWSGTLFRTGTGRLAPEAVTEILNTGDRTLAGPSLPACGLTLVEVTYSHEAE